jgi:hypothetical protein
MLCFALPSLASNIDFNFINFYFKNNHKTYNDYGTIKNYGDFSFKGLWGNSKDRLNIVSEEIMIEDLYCDISLLSCYSSNLRLRKPHFLYDKQQIDLDTYSNAYKIIEIQNNKSKLYSSISKYTIEVDLTNKTASKYKVFENGDVNKYYLILDLAKVNKYIKQLFD